LTGSPHGGAKGILIAAVMAGLLIAGGLGLWYRSRSPKGGASTVTRQELATSVAKMTPDQKQQAYQGEVDALQARGTQLQDYLDTFPKTLTDLDALAQSITTPQAALAYVHDQIALEPYPGVLKGALGTLLTHGGNDLDRSLLLGALLQKQGIDFKIAHGKISGDQAQSLLQQMAGGADAVDQTAKSLPKISPVSEGGGGEPDEQADFQEGVNRRRKELDETVEKTFQQLQSALKAAGIAPGHDATAQQLEVVEDHYWVQATIDDKTVDLDPSATAQPAQSLCPASETLDAGSLPDGLYQRLKFRVVAEHLQSGQVTPTEVLSQEVKSIDLLGKNIRLSVEPESASAQVNQFHPVLSIGDDSTDGQPFALRPDRAESSEGSSDNSAEPTDDTSTAAGQQGGLGGLGGGLGGGLAQAGGVEAPAKKKTLPAPAAAASGGGERVLARLYVEVISAGPHLPEVHYRRTLMDRLGTSGGKQQLLTALADDKTVRPLLVFVWDGAIAVGPFNPVYDFQAETTAIGALEPLEEKIRAKVYLGDDIGDDDVPAPTLSPNLLNYFLASDLARHSLRVKSAPHARSYYQRPRLAFFRHGFVVRDWSKPGSPVRYLEGIDLINSPFGFTGPVEESSSLAMKAGVADTVLERYFRLGGATSNALPLMAAAAAQNVPLQALPPGDSAAVESLALPPPLQTVLQRDAGAGHALLAPARLVSLNGGQQFGWWSVDPATGFTLGRMNLGGSQGMVESGEMNQKITQWTQTFVKFYGNVLKCYLGAAGNALGSVGTDDDLKFQVTLNHGDGSPLPSAEKVSDCLVESACDALGDLLGEEMGDAAAGEEIEGLEQLIANIETRKLAGVGGKSGGKVCTGLVKKAMGG
jgi:hypothetical protein